MLCVLLSACGDGERNNQPSGTSGVNTIQSTQKPEDKKEKTNAEKFLEYAIKAADLRNLQKPAIMQELELHYRIYIRKTL